MNVIYDKKVKFNEKNQEDFKTISAEKIMKNNSDIPMITERIV